MSLFANMTNNGLEETQDRLGGFQPLDTDIYSGQIKMAYAIKSQGGAQGVVFSVEINGKEFTSTQYITNKKGENFFLNKDDNTKKVPLPGFTIVDDLCLCTTGKPLCEQEVEDKVVKIYDYDLKKDANKTVPVLVELLGQTVSLAIQRVIVDKNAKDANGDYRPTGETREENEVQKVFNTEARLSVVEARNGETEPKFWDAWVSRNKGKVQDKSTGADGKSGKPAAAAGAPKAGAAAPRTSLFGKKP